MVLTLLTHCGFKHKHYADASLTRYKASFVANGKIQEVKTYFNETSSSVVKRESVQTVLNAALSRGCEI